jgi:putative phosphoribosyl transferase
VQDRTIILVDDGLATSARLRAAARALRQRGPKRIIAAVPVASRLGMEELRGEVDEIVALTVPESFETIASSYDCFTPSSDDDVLSALGRPTRRVSRMVHDISGRIGDTERTVDVPVGDGQLVGDLGTSHHDGVHESGPSAKDGLVILAHGGGGTRDSYRNRYIAGRLRLSGYATLRVDLLTKHEQEMEAAGGALPFGVARIAARLTDVCDWAVRSGVSGARRTILMVGATGAAAVLATAAQRQGNTFAVVVRGGRVDLTGPRLEQVRAPVLLIVGEADREVARVSSDAMRTLPRSSRLIRVPGAGDAFDEPGALGAAAEQTVKWLDRLMAKRTRTALGLRRSAV